MDDDIDVVVRDVEQQVRLDDLETLVDQRRRVARDDRAHRPGRVGERLLGGYRGQLVPVATAEGAATRGDDEPAYLLARSRTQALRQRRVLGVDRTYLLH